MKYLIILIFLNLTFTVFCQEYELNSENRTAIWKGYGEIGGYVQQGTILAKTGKLNLRNDEIISGYIVFDTKSIHHEDQQLKNHLLKKDFFFTKKYPEAEFQVLNVNQNMVEGIMRIRGIENKMSFPVNYQLVENILFVTGKITIDRTLFGIKYNSSSYFQDLGSYAIKNDFDLQFSLAFDKISSQ